MSRRAFPPDAQPSIAVAIQHVPARAHLLPRLTEALGCDYAENGAGSTSGWASVVVVTGDPERRNPWATYQQCLAVGADGEATHLLVVQDDALPVPRFGERLAAAVAERPGELLCLYVPEHPGYMGRAMRAAHAKGLGFTGIPGGMFTPLVGAVWPLWMAAECLAWVERTPTSQARRCDDALVAKFLRSRRYGALAVVPSLIEHDEATPSTLGLGRYPRHAAILAE